MPKGRGMKKEDKSGFLTVALVFTLYHVVYIPNIGWVV